METKTGSDANILEQYFIAIDRPPHNDGGMTLDVPTFKIKFKYKFSDVIPIFKVNF